MIAKCDQCGRFTTNAEQYDKWQPDPWNGPRVTRLCDKCRWLPMTHERQERTLTDEDARLSGIDIAPSMSVGRGSVILMNAALFIHPLDLLFLTRPNPIEHLYVAMSWITERAHRRLDELDAKLEAMLCD